jgi:hypothetical protein
MSRVINRGASTKAILFTFSVDRVVKKYGINQGKPGVVLINRDESISGKRYFS